MAATSDTGSGWARVTAADGPGVLASVATLVLGLWRLDVPTPHFDATLYTNVGRAYVQGDFSANLEHPPLVKYAFGVAQAALGSGVTAARVASLLAGVITTFLVWRIVARLAGRGPGAAAAMAWALLPQSLSSAELRTVIERPETTALLEPITTLFMVGAALAGLHWLDDGRRRWPVAVGVLVGLAAAAKLIGALVGPPIVVAVWWARRDREAVIGGIGATAVALATWAATYAPFGRTANEAWAWLWDFQTGHLEVGHRQYVAGRVYEDPPWWSPLWHHVDADGWILTAVLLVLLGGLVALRRDPPVVMLGAVVLTLVVALCLASVQLRHYRYVTLPFLHILAALGAAALWQRRARLARTLVTASMAVILVGAVAAVIDRLTVEPTGYGAVADALDDAGHGGPVHVFGAPHLQRYHLGTRVVVEVGVPGEAVPAEDAIVIEHNWELRFPDDRPDALLADRRAVELGPVTLWVPDPA